MTIGTRRRAVDGWLLRSVQQTNATDHPRSTSVPLVIQGDAKRRSTGQR